MLGVGEAFGVDAEEDGDAVARPLGNLGGGDASVPGRMGLADQWCCRRGASARRPGLSEAEAERCAGRGAVCGAALI